MTAILVYGIKLCLPYRYQLTSLWFQDITVGMISKGGSECQFRGMKFSTMYIKLHITVIEYYARISMEN